MKPWRTAISTYERNRILIRGRPVEALGEQLVPGDAEGEHVVKGRPVVRERAQRFRREVHRGAGEGRLDLGARRPGPGGLGAAQAEVRDLGLDVVAGGQQDVGGLEVAVHDPGTVDGGERRRHPHRQALQRSAVHRFAVADRLVQVRSGHVLRDDEEGFALQPGVDDPGGGEPGDPAGGGDLAGEAEPEGLVVGQIRVDQLDGHGAVGGVLGEVDGAHATAAQTADDAVTVEFARVPCAQGFAAFVSVGRHSWGSLVWIV